jgi:hypothetical protein
MSINIAKENANIGKIIYQWKIKEYEQYEQGRTWYLMMGIATLLLMVFGVWTANYLFVLVVALFAIIMYLHGMQEPIELSFAITETGIVLGNKYYRYSELVNFWVIYNPPEVKTLYFSLNKTVKHRLQVSLDNYDPRPIRDYLSQYLEEDLEQEEEPLSDRFARLFRLG